MPGASRKADRLTRRRLFRQAARWAIAAGAAGIAPACGRPGPSAPAGAPPGDRAPTIAVVVKTAGINWFVRMEEGVLEFARTAGVRAFQQGPEKADGALQVRIIEDLIAQKVDALCVVPMSPKTLEPVLKRAMDAGIVVVTHEAPGQENMHADIEAFDNAAYGGLLMDRLAAAMGGKGAYAVFVGSLTSETHNQWVDGAIARQRVKYPEMLLIGGKNETYDDSAKAYEKAKEILKAHPEVRGFLGSASTDAAGVGQALEDMGLHDKVSFAGTSLPSICGKLLDTGAVDAIGFWDPKDAGRALCAAALRLIRGEKLVEGVDLGVPGYGRMNERKPRVWYGEAYVIADRTNREKYAF
jgi:simple sugar transport system substrate-binding protein